MPKARFELDLSTRLQCTVNTEKPEELVLPSPNDDISHPFDKETMHHVKKWLRVAVILLIVNWTVTILLWPLPLHRNYVFTKSFFRGWVTVALVWQFFALFAVFLYPIWDGRQFIARAVKGVIKEVRFWKVSNNS